jgi:hypothetical protein
MEQAKLQQLRIHVVVHAQAHDIPQTQGRWRLLQPNK